MLSIDLSMVEYLRHLHENPMTDLRAAITLLFTFTFVASVLVTPNFSGFTADQLPIAQVDPPIQPAGYAFAIWGLIYAGLAISAIFGLAVRIEDDAWEETRFPLILSLGLGTPWLWVATQNAIAATVLIFAMAFFAIVALLRSPDHDRWLLRAPIALFAGWLTAASFVSLGSVLAGYGLLMDQVGWAYACIGFALVIALIVQNRAKGAPEYGLVVVWALVGIIVANYSEHFIVAVTAGAGIIIILLTLARNTARAPA